MEKKQIEKPNSREETSQIEENQDITPQAKTNIPIVNNFQDSENYHHESQYHVQQEDQQMKDEKENLIIGVSTKNYESDQQMNNASKDSQQIDSRKAQGTKEKIQKLLIEFGVEDEDDLTEFFTYFNSNTYNECFKLIKKKKRDAFIEKFNQILSESCDETKKEEFSLTNQLVAVFKNFQIDEDEYEDIFELFKEEKIDECLLYVKRGKREKLKEELENVKKKMDQSEQKNPNSDKFRQKLYQCFSEAKLDQDEFSKYEQLIIQGKTEEVAQEVILKKREGFHKKLKTILTQFGKSTQNKKKVQKKNILIKYSQTMKQIEFQDTKNLRDQIEKSFGIVRLNEFESQLDGKVKESQQLFQQQQISGKMLEFFTKKKRFYSYNGQIYPIWLSRHASGQRIKQTLFQILKKKDQTIDEISLSFKMEKNLLDNISNLETDQIRSGQLKEIIAETYVTVVVHYRDIKKAYKLKGSNTILELRKHIQKDMLPLEAQSIFSEKQTRTLLKAEQNHLSLREIVGEIREWNIELRNTHTVEFYGFHENRKQTYDQFSEFFAESEEEITKLIKNSNFDDSGLEKLFFDKFINYVYSGIKKRFPIQTTIQKFKDLTAVYKSKNLWMPFDDDLPVTMNEHFLLMYLLYNSEEKLRITLMKLVSKLLPLPMYFRDFANILTVTEEVRKNKEIIWVLKQGITILSIGLHSSEKYQEEKGKSNLLNKIFFTKFVLHNNRHKILQKIPYIAIGVYDQIFPLNIIDIPFDCPTQISHQLALCSDLIIMHSWLSNAKSQKLKEEMQMRYNIKVIVLMRDINIAGQDNLKILKEKKLIENDTINLTNLSNEEKSKSTIKLLRQQFHSLLKSFDRKQKFARIMKFSKDLQLQNMYQDIETLTEKQNEEILKFMGKRMYRSDFDLKNQEIIRPLVESGLNVAIHKILDDLSRQNDTIEIFLDLFRQKLREYQASKISKFMRIYKIKQSLNKLEDLQNEKQKFEAIIEQIHKSLLELPEIYRQGKYITGKKIEQIEKIFDQITSEFENKIRPSIFSVELFWREIYGYLQLGKGILSQEKYQTFLNKVTEIKKREILNNQPFQIIDGDSLKMPKEVMEQVFKPITDNCLVVAILGPQSSGKSTLLNFLFGCDFATSQGRCTRGVYGTFFKVQDKHILNFDGIFVIDTEGLFALTNEKDSKEENRENFDSKLVLFCLAVSDIVLINVRGNLDFNTERIMRICNQKLEALNKSQETKPEIIIVLNQNSTSKTEESENEFKKIRNTFNFKIARSLSLAYVIKNYGNEEISLFSENQILTKKTPLSHFRKETTNLLRQILTLMKQKRTAEKMSEKIEKFFRIWTTVIAFPNLSAMKSKQYVELENEIKGWKKQELQHIEELEKQIMEKIKNEQIQERRGEIQLENINQKYLNAFKKLFYAHKGEQEHVSLIEEEEKEIKHQNKNRIEKLKYSISQNNHQRQLEKQKFEGDFLLKEEENEIIRNQNQNKKQYTIEEKQEIFNNCFEQALAKIKNSMKIQEKCREQESRIKGEYDYYLKNTSKMSSLGLLQEKFHVEPRDWINLSFQQIYQKLKLQFCSPKKFQEFLEYNDKPHTNILKGGQSDAKLKYFDTRKYYKQSHRYKYYSYPLYKLSYCFNQDAFIQTFNNAIEKFKEDNGERKKLKDIHYKINNILEDFNLQLGNFSNFTSIYEIKTKGLWQRFLNYIGYSSEEAKLEVHKRKQKEISESQYWEMFNNPRYKELFTKNIASQIFVRKNQSYQRVVMYQMPIQKVIGEKVEALLDWKKIQQYVKQHSNKNGYQEKERKQRKNQMERQQDENLRKQFNQELSQINVYIPDNISITQMITTTMKENQGKASYSYGPYSYGPYSSGSYSLGYNKGGQFFEKILKTLKKIQPDGEIMSFREYEEKSKNWAYFKYFNGKKLKDSITSTTRQPYYQDDIIVGVIEEEYLEPINKQFEKYQESNSYSLKQQFKSPSFKKFIFSQLQKRGSIETLSNQIKNIIIKTKEKWRKLQGKATAEIYRSVIEEITKFNDDLNQVSYQLGATMMGKLHLLTIYSIWKCQTDLINEKQNEIVEKKLKLKDNQLKRFLMRTSNDLNEKIEQEVLSFQQKIFETFSKMIGDKKSKLFEENKKKFVEQYNRKEIQREIDLQIFQKDTDPEEVLKYLQKPAQFLTKKYELIYEKFWENLIRKFLKENLVQIVRKDIQVILSAFLSHLTSKQMITQEKGIARDIFEIQAGVPGELDYDEESKNVLFKYFMDRLCKSDPDKLRKCLDLTLKPRKQSNILPKVGQTVEDIFLKIRYLQLKITNLPIFIHKILSDSSMQKIEEELGYIYEFSDEQKKNFINSISVSICPEKCPCCGRICGLEQQIHNFHKCVYGHQMRALAGNYIENSKGEKEAFVVSCDQMQETDIMDYNGNKYTWTEFKNYWANKPAGGWKYDDIVKQKDIADRIKSAWLKAGPIYCQRNNLVYADYTDSTKQKQETIKNVHFIFAIDSSYSMSGQPWNQLKMALEKTVKKIKNYALKGGNQVISLFRFNSSYETIFLREKPQNINVNSISYSGGGTDFQEVFGAVSRLASQYISQQTIIFIFMTDGQASFPSVGISKMQEISKNYPKKFIYTGIQFGCDTEVMKNICMALEGTNQIADNFDQLVMAFSSAIEIIAHKQKPNYGMMEIN